MCVCVYRHACMHVSKVYEEDTTCRIHKKIRKIRHPCVLVCIYACMYMCMYVKYMRKRLHFLFRKTFIIKYDVYKYLSVCVYIYIYVCVYIYIYIYIYIHVCKGI